MEKKSEWKLSAARSASFPQPAIREWLERAEKSWKGEEPFRPERTDGDGIRVKMLYTKEDLPYGTVPPEIRGTAWKRQGPANRWRSAQPAAGGTARELSENIGKSLDRGQDTVCFSLPETLRLEDLDLLFPPGLLDEYPIAVRDDVKTVPFLWMMRAWAERKGKNPPRIRGFVGFDPLVLPLQSREFLPRFFPVYEGWLEAVVASGEKFPGLRTVFVDGTVYERGALSIPEQLAFAFAAFVFHVENLRKKGIPPSDIFSKTVLAFSVGSSFFPEIAKLRAAKYLWKLLAKAYQIGGDVPKITIYAETSPVNKTAADPFVNMLRSANEAFAAVVGQVDFLHVLPYDRVLAEKTGLGERIALNTHHILREEARMHAVADAAGGSYYIESLTKQIIERAWQLFLEIDGKGGILSLLEKGEWFETVRNRKEERIRSVHTGETKLIGTNVYRDPKEKIPSAGEGKGEGAEVLLLAPRQPEEILSLVQGGATIGDFLEKAQIPDGLLNERLSGRLESLLAESRTFIKEAGKLAVGLIGFGDPKEHRREMDFALSFFAVGGFACVECGPVREAGEALGFIERTSLPVYCLCGSRKVELLLDTVRKIKEKGIPASLFSTAGDGKLAEAGVTAIGEKSDRYRILKGLLEKIMEMNGNEA